MFAQDPTNQNFPPRGGFVRPQQQAPFVPSYIPSQSQPTFGIPTVRPPQSATTARPVEPVPAIDDNSEDYFRLNKKTTLWASLGIGIPILAAMAAGIYFLFKYRRESMKCREMYIQGEKDYNEMLRLLQACQEELADVDGNTNICPPCQPSIPERSPLRPVPREERSPIPINKPTELAEGEVTYKVNTSTKNVARCVGRGKGRPAKCTTIGRLSNITEDMSDDDIKEQLKIFVRELNE